MQHTFPSERISDLANVMRGLTVDEVEARQRLYGPNDIVREESSGWLDIVRDTALDPMVWFLVATALLFAALGDYTEAVVLGSALLPIVGMDAYLHRRTQASTEGLAGRLAATAGVLREATRLDVPAVELVPGDLVIVSAGQYFPADGLLIAGANLQVDESALTGEAMPVRKHPYQAALDMAGEIAVADDHWGAAGTRLLTGEAQLRVVFTGRETLYGEIVRFAQAGQHERTALQTAVGDLVSALLVIAAIFCVALAAIRLYQGHGLLDAFLSAVTLAVAALPEEFPVVFTFFLGVGVYRLARRQALVRRAVVVENIGRVTCICSDKTGTITQGRLRLVHLIPRQGVSEADLQRIAATASRRESKDPLDDAILAGHAEERTQRLASFPFTEDRRRESGVVLQAARHVVIATKGAPETILRMSRLSAEERAVWLTKTAELAGAGHKVIAAASQHMPEWRGQEPDHDYDFAGLLAFADPVREGVKEAVARAQHAGIRVIMVTGDHVATARAIARETGIGGNQPAVVEGAELGRHLARSGRDGLDQLDVLARAAPAQKLELVRALRNAGEVVAVTGDGVNDVPALQGADIGIAMGERGTRTAREVASIVLLDDNFRTIVRAIAEGRQLFLNLKLSFAFLLMVHTPLVATAALVPLVGFPLLYLPMHVVWLELIMHPVALLVFQELPPSHGLAPVRRASRLQFYDWREWSVIAIVSILITLLIVLGYARSLGIDRDVEHARNMAMVSLVVASATITAGLSGLRSRAALVAVATTIASALVLSQVAMFAALLHLRPLHWDDWFIAAAGGLVIGAIAALLPKLSNTGEPPVPN